MNWADYCILAVLALSVVGGIWRGLVSEVLTLGTWVLAFWAAWAFGPAIAAHFEHSVASPAVRIIAAYVASFVVVWVLGTLAVFFIHKLVVGIGLGGPDRLFGGLFGLARGVFLVTLLVFLAGFTVATRDAWWRQSALLPHFQQVAIWMQERIPPDVGKYLHPERVLAGLPRLRVPSAHPISAASAPAAPASVRHAPARSGSGADARTPR